VVPGCSIIFLDASLSTLRAPVAHIEPIRQQKKERQRILSLFRTSESRGAIRPRNRVTSFSREPLKVFPGISAVSEQSMTWKQTAEIDVYDDRGNRLTLRHFTDIDTCGNVVRQEYRTASGMVVKQLS
jgi:hypothetical protein